MKPRRTQMSLIKKISLVFLFCFTCNDIAMAETKLIVATNKTGYLAVIAIESIDGTYGYSIGWTLAARCQIEQGVAGCTSIRTISSDKPYSGIMECIAPGKIEYIAFSGKTAEKAELDIVIQTKSAGYNAETQCVKTTAEDFGAMVNPEKQMLYGYVSITSSRHDGNIHIYPRLHATKSEAIEYCEYKTCAVYSNRHIVAKICYSGRKKWWHVVTSNESYEEAREKLATPPAGYACNQSEIPPYPPLNPQWHSVARNNQGGWSIVVRNTEESARVAATKLCQTYGLPCETNISVETYGWVIVGLSCAADGSTQTFLSASRHGKDSAVKQIYAKAAATEKFNVNDDCVIDIIDPRYK